MWPVSSTISACLQFISSSGSRRVLCLLAGSTVMGCVTRFAGAKFVSPIVVVVERIYSSLQRVVLLFPVFHAFCLVF